ncbi:hypothetical protein [Sphingopyxis sp.]|uniref:hypothetical protein n=1 Tax=Sphingopyxis sp. TaxID=1908224 RepID=UPI0035B1EE14
MRLFNPSDDRNAKHAGERNLANQRYPWTGFPSRMSYLPGRNMLPDAAPLRKTPQKGKPGLARHLTQISPLAAHKRGDGGD